MADANNAPFEISFQVAATDIDGNGHVNNVVYLRWMQDVALAHWDAWASDEEKARTAWVVRRHEIDYLLPARLGDPVIARTWVGTPTAATWERFTEILRVDDRRTLIRARSVWCVLDLQTGRPRRIDAALRARFPSSEG